jgi:hypothetical protein
MISAQETVFVIALPLPDQHSCFVSGSCKDIGNMLRFKQNCRKYVKQEVHDGPISLTSSK